MSKPWIQRQHLFVNRVLQGRVIANVAWYWCIYHIALWHAMFLFYFLQYRRELEAGGPVHTFSELYLSFAASHIAVIFCAAIVLPVVLWDVLKLTHRVAGPLVRFTAIFRQLARGESVGTFQLRKGDLLVGLQDAVNEFLASPYAPRRHKSTAQARDEKVNEDITELLSDIREIQASLCRVYDPAHDTAKASPEWVSDLQRPVDLNACDEVCLDREQAREKSPDTQAAGTALVAVEAVNPS